MKKRLKSVLSFILLILLVLSIARLVLVKDPRGPQLKNYGSQTISDYYYSDSYRTYDEISSKNMVLINREGEIFLGKNPEERIHPASMTKVMTGILALENIANLDERIVIEGETLDYCLSEGMSITGYEPGDRPKAIDLIYSALLESSGEASISLAKHIGGSEEGFARLMNEKAQDLSMDSSHFSNSTGITSPENYSSSLDIAKLFNYAMANPQFREIIKSHDHMVKGHQDFLSKRPLNNRLFQIIKSQDMDLSHIRAGKTGYTEAAGLCLVSMGEVEGQEYILVTAGAEGNPHTEQYNIVDSLKIYRMIVEE